jgi:ferric-dicitrate binding protein FerR (iron transport regulator)
MPDTEKQLLWQRIQATLATDKAVPPPARPNGTGGSPRPWPCCCRRRLGLALVRQPRVYFTTGFGQTRQLVLPDRSVVTLNGNSTLSYRPAWPGDRPREVWLEGKLSLT